MPPIKVENNERLKVKETIYSVGLIGHTYNTLSGATINTEAIENKSDNYIVKEGDHTANILVSLNLTSIQYLLRFYFSVFVTMVFCSICHDGILQELNQHATNGVIHAIDKIL